MFFCFVFKEEVEFDVAPPKEKIQTDQSEDAKGDTKSDKEHDKIDPVNSNIIKKEVQEGSRKAKEDDMKKGVILPVSGQEAEQPSSKETKKKQEETEKVDEK